MKKRILPVILLSLVTACTVFSLAFLPELRALVTAGSHTAEQLEQMQQQNRQQMAETAFSLTGMVFNPLTTAQAAALDAKLMTEAEAVDIVLGRMGAPACSTDFERNKNEVTEHIATVYILKDLFKYRLNVLFEQAKADYKALPPDSRSSLTELSGLLSKYGDIAKVLENECNGRMDDICARLDTLLPLVGGDGNITRRIRYIYAQEKHLTKSYYMDMYAGKLAEIS